MNNDYTFQFRGHKYQIAEPGIVAGMKGNAIRVEERLDGSLAVRFGSGYVPISICPPIAEAMPRDPYQVTRKDHNRGGRSTWMKKFSVANRNNTARLRG